MIGKCIGNYIIERPLAQGGMGAVFVARDRVLGRQVAMKFINQNPECTADTARRFLDEARITASLQNPNIVTIFDYGELEGRLYYVMELLAGSDLATLLKPKKRLDIQRAKNYLDQICSGLHAAHAVGVVHRDLKPSNIFVLEGDPLQVKLMDFGVAKVLSIEEDHTCHGQIIGTPRYMSPEQASGNVERVSPLSDVYSLGIILYEMLTGAGVFENSSSMELLLMHVRNPVPKIRVLAPEVPAGIARVIEACLAKAPSDRPQSVLEVSKLFAKACIVPVANLQIGSVASATLVEPVSVSTSGPICPVAYNDTISVASAKTPVQEDRERASTPYATNVSDSEITPLLEHSIPSQPALHTLRLGKADRAKLTRLWNKMQEQSEFPAFIRDGSEFKKIAQFGSAHAASKLAASILKDAALTAKLLRIVNSAYANRFGGKVDSIQHAIVILGIDCVRSIALSISLFENQGSDEQSLRISGSAISSLISGEMAQQFAPYAKVSDAEQAMLCGMFRNFGRHLAMVYLPQQFDQILTLSQQTNVTLDVAAESVIGLSLRKLGLGLAERWRLPKPLLGIMSNVPGLSGRWAHEEDRMVALVEFSNELCEIVTSESAPTQLAIENLLVRYKSLLTIDLATMDELLKSVQESFERRYSSLLGLDSTKSSLSRSGTRIVATPDFRTVTLRKMATPSPTEATWVKVGEGPK